jgi:SulP family sulfate permease
MMLVIEPLPMVNFFFLFDLTFNVLNVFPEIQGQPDPEYPSVPFNTLVKAFSSYGEIDPDLFRPIEKYLELMSFPEGSVLWTQDEAPDGLYIVESGILRATYQFADHTPCIEESMVPGTVAGELSALSNLPRNATVIVERDATVWRLSMEDLARLDKEEPRLARSFLLLILKGQLLTVVSRDSTDVVLAAKIDHDILLSALACRQ